MHDTLALNGGISADASARVEADHRIANNLTSLAAMMRVHSNALPVDAVFDHAFVQTLLRQVSTRIDAVAHLHRFLARAPDQESVDLAGYLDELTRAVIVTMGVSASLRLELELEAVRMMPASKAAPIGLLVTEALTNAIKYAHPTGVDGMVRVACLEDSEGRLLIAVEDDGVGLPDTMDHVSGGGFGLRIMRALAAQIGGTLGVHSSALGLRVVLTL